MEPKPVLQTLKEELTQDVRQLLAAARHRQRNRVDSVVQGMIRRIRTTVEGLASDHQVDPLSGLILLQKLSKTEAMIEQLKNISRADFASWAPVSRNGPTAQIRSDPHRPVYGLPRLCEFEEALERILFRLDPRETTRAQEILARVETQSKPRESDPGLELSEKDAEDTPAATSVPDHPLAPAILAHRV